MKLIVRNGQVYVRHWFRYYALYGEVLRKIEVEKDEYLPND